MRAHHRVPLPRSLTAVLFIAAVTGTIMAQTPPVPPVAAVKPKVDRVHGDERTDNYYWLREKTNPEVIAYLEAENAYAESRLSHTKGLQEKLYSEIVGRIKQTDLSVPYRKDGWWYFSKTEEGKQYPFYLRKKGSMEGPEELLLDVNALAEGKRFMSVGAMSVSPDGNLLAFSTDSTGFRVYNLQVKDLRTGSMLPDAAADVSSVFWAADSKTLFYVINDSAKRPFRLYRHVIGTTVPDLVYEEKDERFNVGGGMTLDKKFLMLFMGSHTTSEIRYLPADRPAGEWKTLLSRKQDREGQADHRGGLFYMLVNDKGRNFRLVTVPDNAATGSSWKELIAHRDDVMLEGIDCFKDHYVVSERKDASQQLLVTDARTAKSHHISFPDPAYSLFPSTNAEFDTPLFRYSYQSLVIPSSVYDYNMDTKETTLLKREEVLGGYDQSLYVSERIFATAKDGIRIPISLVYRKGLVRDGKAPALLIGYGAYGYPQPPTFGHARVSLLDRGFVVAMAHIRGGGDMGKKWHDDGRMMKKMNTFADFIACAEQLVADKYTSPKGLVAQGGSAGGLLMGAIANMRPGLFRGVILAVPFVDVINTMLDESLPLTVGEFEEWGNPKKKEEYEYMKRYSPYDNIEAKAYPAMLVHTSLNDSQVMYWEPAKYVAKMRVTRTDKEPLLFFINMKGGHGGFSGRYDRYRDTARDYAFMLDLMGMTQ
jgi:oligopeptidase B